MKKTILLFLFIILLLNVKAQVVTIPDTNFKNYLLSDTLVNSNQDSFIQLNEVQAITHLNVSNLAIVDLTGIETFSSLANLNCSNNQLTNLDISRNVEIDTLTCESNNLTAVCINNNQYQYITEYPNNWVKDPTCEWNRKDCSIESDSCFALFYITFVDSVETFYAWVDSLSTEKAVSFNWDFGDLGISTQQPAPAYYYGRAEQYTPCMKIYTASGDSCEYCHTIGYDTARNIVKHGGGFNFRVKQFESTYFSDTPIVDTIVVDTVVGIDQKSSMLATYSIQPNPTEDIINIVFENAVKNISIKLLNTTGELLLEQKNRSGNRFIMDIRNQPNGLYIIEIIHNGIVSYSKIIRK